MVLVTQVWQIRLMANTIDGDKSVSTQENNGRAQVTDKTVVGEMADHD